MVPMSKKSDSKLLVVLSGLLIMGCIFIIPDFGESVDEWHNAFYGELFLNLYDRGSFLQDPGVDYYNGPFYFMFMSAASRFFQAIFPGWMIADGRHFLNFATFLMGALCLFDLTSRLLSRKAGWIALALYLSQPLLIGHAFINQKDTPLMAFFLLSLDLGWRMAERWPAPDPERPSLRMRWSLLRLGFAAEWAGKSRLVRVVTLAFSLILLVILSDLWLERFLYPHMQAALRAAYQGSAFPVLQSLFDRIASDAYKTPLEQYLLKLDRAFLWGRFIFTLAVIGSIPPWTRKLLPETYRRHLDRPMTAAGVVLAASVALGFTTSIRLVGPLAGLIVSLHFLKRRGWRTISVLLFYWGAGALFSYLTWPAIWGASFSQLLDRLRATAEFADFTVLYRGTVYTSENLPWHYVPTLLSLQLTIPTVILIIIGIVRQGSRARRKEHPNAIITLLLWLIIPLLLAATGIIPIYDNFRHLLFMVPALLVLGAEGLVAFVNLIRRRWVRATAIALILLPGLTAMIELHPYQYIYYNQFAGGVQGVAGDYALDYWCTSMRAAAAYVNGIAAEGARVAVSGALTTAEPYLRRDLDIYVDRTGASDPDIGMHCNKFTPKLRFFSGLRLVHEIGHGDAVFAIVESASWP